MGTAAAHTVAAHALIVRGTGVAWGEDGAQPVTRRTDSHCTCAGGVPAFPASARHVYFTTPFHPLPWQELEICFFAKRFEQQAAGQVVDTPVSQIWQRAPLASPAACPTTAP